MIEAVGREIHDNPEQLEVAAEEGEAANLEPSEQSDHDNSLVNIDDLLENSDDDLFWINKHFL